MQLYCAACGASQATVKEEITSQCPECHVETVWTSAPIVSVPKPAAKFTRDDLTFLRSIESGTWRPRDG